MAWNDSGNGKDPWKKEGSEPHDLDRIVQNWQRRISAIFGGGGGGGSRSPGGASGAWILVGLLLIAWALTGLYRVDEAERGIVQRFGAYTVTALPGLHWHLPYPIETVDIVNTEAVANYSFQTEILTADESYVFIQMVVQYRRSDPVKFIFEVVDPEITVQQVTESALREVVGTSSLEVLVTESRDEIAPRTREILQNTLDTYGLGVTVTSISLENLDYPPAVQAAVDDTQKSRNDRDRYILEADTYAQSLVPQARGQAARILEEAEAYRERVIAAAEGDASRFEALLTEYQQAPRVTRARLYIEAVQDVYQKSNKVLIDADGSGNLLYLPLDKLIGNPNRLSATDPARSLDTRMPSEGVAPDESETARDRRTRQ
ncbi:MAG: FtsH protease activity modulator HflK [Woeseiaceae bacterium]